MKTTIKLSALVLAAAFVFGGTSCKKGEDDPFLSVKSRKSRLTGQWKMTSMTWTDKTTQGGSTDTETWVSTDGETLIYTESDGTVSEWSVQDISYMFDKDNSYENMMNVTMTKYDGVDIPASAQAPTTETYKGSWSWLGKDKNGEYKNKERIALRQTESTSTYDGNVSSDYSFTGNNVLGGSMVLHKLSNKELVLTDNMTRVDEENNITYETEVTMTFEKQ